MVRAKIRTIAVIFLLVGILTFTILVFFTPLANWLAEPLYVESTPRKADVIVVLSGGSYPNGSLSYFTLERVVYGIELYQQGLAEKIIFSGGKSRRDSSSDAENMKQFALDMGIPEEDIVTEPESKNTHENIFKTVEIMGKNGWESALLVTTPIHLYRSRLITQKTDLDFIPASPPSFDKYRQVPIDRGLLFYFTFREYGALVLQQLKALI